MLIFFSYLELGMGEFLSRECNVQLSGGIFTRLLIVRFFLIFFTSDLSDRGGTVIFISCVLLRRP